MFLGNVSLRNETWWCGNMCILVIVAEQLVWEVKSIYPLEKFVYTLNFIECLILNVKGEAICFHVYSCYFLWKHLCFYEFQEFEFLLLPFKLDIAEYCWHHRLEEQ